MSVYEDSHKPPLQGVSQQIPQMRLPGQITAQDNMLSDSVTGLRRRPGVQLRYSKAFSSTKDKIAAWFTDLAGTQVHIILNTQTGVVTLLDSAYTELAVLAPNSYLIASDARDIRGAVCDDTFFLANVGVKPTVQAASGGLDPNRRGYAFVRTGAFGKQYDLQVSVGGVVTTVSYTTPDGSTAGDAVKATGEYIINELYTALASVSGLTRYKDKGFMYLEATSDLIVSTSTGSTYMLASKANYTSQESDLPSRLPAQADGFIVRVGDLRTPKYFKYSSADQAWLESGDFTSPAGLLNMPVGIVFDTVWKYSTTAYEGRLAGDGESNPTPPFVDNGITGLSTYQGRLVILAGNRVSLSASNEPYRFYRSTVASLIDSDPIHVGSSATTSAAYSHALPFNKDLVLFSSNYQAVMPATNSAITPRTATVLPTSQYSGDVTTSPVALGRSIMYAVPLSTEYFGMMEMLPSQYTDSQYTSYEATAHIPRYMRGKCRGAAASTVSNMAVFQPSANTKALVVHQYMWNGEEKAQQAWHSWYFKLDIAAVYFSRDVINILFYEDGYVLLGSIDPKASAVQLDGARPFADLFWYGTADSSGNVAVPAALAAQDATYTGQCYAAGASGADDLRGEPVQFSVSGSTATVDADWLAVTNQYVFGYPYRSSFVPTVPMVLDYQGNRVDTNKLTLLRYYISTNNSSEYKVLVADSRMDSTPESIDVATLFFESAELELGQSPVAQEAAAVVPCRTDAKSTTLLVYTDGARELNITGLEFACRYHQRLGRK